MVTTPTLAPVERVVLARLDLPAEPASVGEARRFVLRLIDGTVDDELVDAAVVITSELVTNAMLHAQTSFEVVVLREGDAVRIEVHDGSDRLPRRKRYSDHSATGRGLWLVETLATAAGAERTDDGKVVWAVVGDLPDEPPAVGQVGADVVPLEAGLPRPDLTDRAGEEDQLQVAAGTGPEVHDDTGSRALVRA